MATAWGVRGLLWVTQWKVERFYKMNVGCLSHIFKCGVVGVVAVPKPIAHWHLSNSKFAAYKHQPEPPLHTHTHSHTLAVSISHYAAEWVAEQWGLTYNPDVPLLSLLVLFFIFTLPPASGHFLEKVCVVFSTSPHLWLKQALHSHKSDPLISSVHLTTCWDIADGALLCLSTLLDGSWIARLRAFAIF